MTTRTLLAIRHVVFEDLGSLAAPLEHAGYRVAYHDVADGGLDAIDPLAADLLVVLGGPIGVGDAAIHPCIGEEQDLLRRRLEKDRPTLGICLGAQLIAAALGARVYPASRKEIGWGSIDLTAAGRAGPLGTRDGLPVLHWHGDTFDLPAGCELLASTAICPNQAFARGPNALALQFHVEARLPGFESWLIGHASELAGAGIDVRALRAETERAAPRNEPAARAMIDNWLAGLR